MSSSLLAFYLSPHSPDSGDSGSGARPLQARAGDDAPNAPGALSKADAVLVERVRAGDAAALEAIFYTHGARLLRFATQQLRAIDAAEDVVQDVFLGIWRIRARWTVRSSLASYLFQAVRRRIINRAQQRPAEDPRVATPLLVDELPGQAAAAPDRIVEDAELRRAIRRAVALLSPRTREVFQLSRDHGLSYREIAETLGVSVKTVEMHVGRALAALRIALAGWM